MQEFIDMITQDSLVYGLICISLSVIIILVLVDKNLKRLGVLRLVLALGIGLLGPWCCSYDFY
jgi:uncharacterized oligopeptide transporter (OPT) family protein